MSERAIEQKPAALDDVPTNYEDAVRLLAAAHSAGADPVKIYSVPDPQKQVVRLIEVSEAFPEGTVERSVRSNGTERVVPIFPMGPARDFPFRSEIAQVTPFEWEQLRQKTLRLNRDWDLSQARQVRHAE